jgi:hypothetical protein
MIEPQRRRLQMIKPQMMTPPYDRTAKVTPPHDRTTNDDASKQSNCKWRRFLMIELQMTTPQKWSNCKWRRLRKKSHFLRYPGHMLVALSSQPIKFTGCFGRQWARSSFSGKKHGFSAALLTVHCRHVDLHSIRTMMGLQAAKPWE